MNIEHSTVFRKIFWDGRCTADTRFELHVFLIVSLANHLSWLTYGPEYDDKISKIDLTVAHLVANEKQG